MPDALADLHARLCLEKYKIRLMKGVDRMAERSRNDADEFFRGIGGLLADELGCRLTWIGDGFGKAIFSMDVDGERDSVPDGWAERRVLLHYYDEPGKVKCALYLLLPKTLAGAASQDDPVGQGRALLTSLMAEEGERFGEILAEVLDTAGFDNFIAQVLARHDELASCVGGELAELIMRHGISCRALRPSRKYMGYLFADVCGYTTFAASNPPEAVMETLNRFLAGAVQIINRFSHCMLDKYVGDCLVILVGALDGGSAEEAQASRLDAFYAEEGVALAGELMQFSRTQGFELSAGFHLGEGHAGFIGVEDSEEHLGDRLDFTAIGRNMNYAARLQQAAGRGTLLVSGEVRGLLQEGGKYTFQRLTRQFKHLGKEIVYQVQWP